MDYINKVSTFLHKYHRNRLPPSILNSAISYTLPQTDTTSKTSTSTPKSPSQHREPGGLLSSHLVDRALVPEWARNQGQVSGGTESDRKELTSNPNDSTRSPQLKEIPRLQGLRFAVGDVVVESLDEEVEAIVKEDVEAGRRSAVSMRGLGDLLHNDVKGKRVSRDTWNETSGEGTSESAAVLADATTQITVEKEETIVLVSISGISSSGKSTLAYLLNEVFNPETEHEKANGRRKQRILAQDDFFKVMTAVPTTSFLVDEGEKEFMLKSMKCSLDLYEIEELVGDNQRYGEQKWKVTGPDTDCAEAFDFEALGKAVRDLKERGEVLSTVEIEGTSLGLVDSAVKVQYHDLITHLRQRVANILANTTKKYTFVFVEGMLLFTNPHVPATPARAALSSHHQIQLFLPTSKQAAQSRRLARPIYTDVEKGGMRFPGQMWKTIGYFNSVVWWNYIKTYGWLIGNNGDDVGNILVRGKDWDVSRSLKWGVEKIIWETLGRF